MNEREQKETKEAKHLDAPMIPYNVNFLRCDAMNCVHNTAMRSGGESMGRCDFKHVWIREDGKCDSYKDSVEGD